jgi:hypothetical protein
MDAASVHYLQLKQLLSCRTGRPLVRQQRLQQHQQQLRQHLLLPRAAKLMQLVLHL